MYTNKENVSEFLLYRLAKKNSRCFQTEVENIDQVEQ